MQNLRGFLCPHGCRGYQSTARLKFGAPGRNRTINPLLTRQPLYHLSYRSLGCVCVRFHLSLSPS